MLRNLDVLRAVAVLSVVVAHLFRHVLSVENIGVLSMDELGRFGVLVFFVHTSLVLLMSLDRTVTEERFVIPFYIRRFFRVYPLSVLTVLVAVAFRIPSMPDEPYAAIGLGQLIENLFLIQNLTLEPTLIRYSIITPLWSLPFEVQMYLALPFLHRLLSRQNSAFLVATLWLAAVILRVGMITAGWNTFVLHFVPCFLGGALAHQLGRTQRARLSGRVWPFAIAALLALYAGARDRAESPLLDYLLCLGLGALIPLFRDLPATPLTQLSQIVAKYSYGIYLSHAPVMWLAFFSLAPYFKVVVQWIAFVGFIGLVPWAVYRWVEHPMIEFGRLLSQRGRTRSAGLVSQVSA
jgi:peptidoglycan/LPS O-acetylase OafA/YrhL